MDFTVEELIDRPDSLIIVVDVIEGFTRVGSLASKNGESVIPSIAALLSKAKSDVCYLRDFHTSTSRELKSFPPHCMGDKESELVVELSPYRGMDVKKNSTNGFFRLKEQVDLDKYAGFVIVGLCTDICVLHLAITLKTYFDEYDLDKQVYVVESLCKTYDSPSHSADEQSQAALSVMRTAGINII